MNLRAEICRGSRTAVAGLLPRIFSATILSPSVTGQQAWLWGSDVGCRLYEPMVLGSTSCTKNRPSVLTIGTGCYHRYRLQQQLVPLAWTDGPFSSSVTRIYLVGNIATDLARSISLPNFGFQTNQMLKIWQCHNFSWVSFGGQPSRPYIQWRS